MKHVVRKSNTFTTNRCITLLEVTRVEIGRTEESTVARYMATKTFDAQEFKYLDFAIEP